MYWSAKLKKLIGWESEAKLPELFSGDGVPDLVKKTLRENPAIRGNSTIIDRLLGQGRVEFFRRGDCLIHEGGQDNDVFFLLAGEVDIVFRRQLGSKRVAPNQVGEMAAIELGSKRTASVYALTDEVAALKVSGQEFNRIWTDNPEFQKNLQIEMTARHRERIAAGEVAKRNNSSSWFLISAGVGLASCLMTWLLLIPPFWSHDARLAATVMTGFGLFVLMLLHNPAFFWRRCFGLVLFAMVGVLALAQFVSVEAENGFGSLKIEIHSGETESDWKQNLINQAAFVFTLSICAWMDRRINPD
ncbi:Cyclic nucleotide-binding domain-containing protein [Poseidonocella pacifica]|uniref:Cyclic nucleotide-binding domain-containing protein n=1 Tax=Poseidonocella pacifica TaxID=871651 RepID=A0A1I0WKL1_9RHOB|nr:cyclic nucleotide-binding domain-containing protein [Poseidonocella pacifica]SFA88937.1 Cyclic nucleotide-binding domain-containing protein [Poseidonocella pacifica]